MCMSIFIMTYKKGASAPALLSQCAFLTPGGIVRFCYPLPY